MSHEEFEKKVMETILDEDGEFFCCLREQYAHAMVTSREFTGSGFFTTYEAQGGLGEEPLSGKIDDVVAKFENGEEYYFILYIEKGRIDTLEGFATLDEWQYNYDAAVIKHCFEGKREFNLHK